MRYLCAIKDCCSNKIVGYFIDSRIEFLLAVVALQKKSHPLTGRGAGRSGLFGSQKLNPVCVTANVLLLGGSGLARAERAAELKLLGGVRRCAGELACRLVAKPLLRFVHPDREALGR